MTGLNLHSKRIVVPAVALILVLAAWCFFSYFVFGSLKPVIRPPHECKEIERLIGTPSSPSGQSPEDAQQRLDRLNIICNIKRTAFWYSTNAKINQVFYSYGTLAVIILSFLTALFIGADLSKRSESWRVITLSLPLLSTAIAAITAQFHFQESWVLRENGRIEAENLLATAEALPDDPKAFAVGISEIRSRLLGLEKDQAGQYFAYRFRDGKNEAEAGPKDGEGGKAPNANQ
ncbi:DUF4231 domain-containing protein [Agrobacterium rhizogenes]|nr:DUF4231 domain-containing protein [Rhizobium rhizogenes]OCJ27296.1 hypothetical protein A6U89_29415 [Agrobacterium sp. B133/95]NTH99983.1 DUF4231 domain-containing protein [Rhizobium rhizogenes]NTI52816.1 DUF4231 domain-containing protein [Rhizobium rhizogenes]NTI98189.1 DUF4231 domain-containing protein [Rhizobium rhizogenes]